MRSDSQGLRVINEKRIYTRAAITAVEAYVPDYVLTNAELETMVDTTDEWIRSRTGISERRILKDKNKPSSYMGAQAVKRLCRKKGIDPKEIDLLICSTATPDMPFPATANIICNEAGATNAFSFDLMAACSGFLFALVTGQKYIESGTHKKVVVLGTDKMSSIVDYSDRSICVLFGDGCGAVLLEPSTDGNGIIDAILRSDGHGKNLLHMKAGGSANPATHQTVDAREHYIFQEGKSVFKFAVKNMADVAAEIMERNHLGSGDIAWLVPHQANRRIVDATVRRMGIGDEKVMINIERYGNTTTASIPLCLWEWEKKIREGDNLILAAFGGGFTWGAVYLKWAYNSPTNYELRITNKE